MLINAAKFTNEVANPRIEVRHRYDENERVFYICDNGISIDPRYHERIFDPFEKLHPETAGSGVGLTIVKRIIQVHGERIWVECEEVVVMA